MVENTKFKHNNFKYEILEKLHLAVENFILNNPPKKLTREFYENNDTLYIAQTILHSLLWTRINNQLTVGKISEVEAYQAGVSSVVDDVVSPAYSLKPTKRTYSIFEQGGTAYIYTCYGVHTLMNISVQKKSIPHCILIRAVCPIIGIKYMLQRRQILFAFKQTKKKKKRRKRRRLTHMDPDDEDDEDIDYFDEDDVKIHDYDDESNIVDDYANEEASDDVRESSVKTRKKSLLSSKKGDDEPKKSRKHKDVESAETYSGKAKLGHTFVSMYKEEKSSERKSDITQNKHQNGSIADLKRPRKRGRRKKDEDILETQSMFLKNEIDLSQNCIPEYISSMVKCDLSSSEFVLIKRQPNELILEQQSADARMTCQKKIPTSNEKTCVWRISSTTIKNEDPNGKIQLIRSKSSPKEIIKPQAIQQEPNNLSPDQKGEESSCFNNSQSSSETEMNIKHPFNPFKLAQRYALTDSNNQLSEFLKDESARPEMNNRVYDRSEEEAVDSSSGEAADTLLRQAANSIIGEATETVSRGVASTISGTAEYNVSGEAADKILEETETSVETNKTDGSITLGLPSVESLVLRETAENQSFSKNLKPNFLGNETNLSVQKEFLEVKPDFCNNRISEQNQRDSPYQNVVSSNKCDMKTNDYSPLFVANSTNYECGKSFEDLKNFEGTESLTSVPTSSKENLLSHPDIMKDLDSQTFIKCEDKPSLTTQEDGLQPTVGEINTFSENNKDLSNDETQEAFSSDEVARNPTFINSLCRGPGCLCQCFGITKELNNIDTVESDELFISEPINHSKLMLYVKSLDYFKDMEEKILVQYLESYWGIYDNKKYIQNIRRSMRIGVGSSTSSNLLFRFFIYKDASVTRSTFNRQSFPAEAFIDSANHVCSYLIEKHS